LYAPPNITLVTKLSSVRQAGHVAHMEEMRNPYSFLIGKAEGKRLLGRPRHRFEGNIKVGFREIEWGVCELDLSGSG